jgi:hypothetical protein
MEFHNWRFHDRLAYIHFNSGQQNLIRLPPFAELINLRSADNVLYAHSFIGPWVLSAFGAWLIFGKSIPIALFASIFALYVSCLNHIDIYRYALPCSMFAFMVGFERFWADKRAVLACILVLPFYLVAMAIYVKGQIHSNKAWPQFMEDVLAD